jgi:transposase InsO family protein
MILEQCPDTRHTVAFPTDTFDIKFKTVPILLAEMRQHARRAPDRPAAANYSAALAITAPPPSRTPKSSRQIPSAGEPEKCNQCGKMVKDIYFHLFEQHLDTLHPKSQARLTAQHGSAGAKQTHKHTRGAGKLLSLTNSAGQSMHAAAQAYGAAGATWFLWEGEKINIGTEYTSQNNEIPQQCFSVSVSVPGKRAPLLALPPHANDAHKIAAFEPLPAIIDCGASVTCAPAPSHMLRFLGIPGVSGGPQVLTTANGGTVHAKEVSMSFSTCLLDGKPYSLTLPGCYTSPELKHVLISYDHLLRQGFEPRLRKDGGEILTPDGLSIPLYKDPTTKLWSLLDSRHSSNAPTPGKVLAVTRAAKLAAPTQIQHDLAKAKHLQEAHCGARKLLVKYPDLHPRAVHDLECGDCATMKARKGPDTKDKPRRSGPSRENPGTALHIDWLGKQKLGEEAIDGEAWPALDGTADALLIVDESSTAYVVCPAKDTKAATVINLLQSFQAGGPKITRLRADNEFNSKELRDWMSNNGTRTEFSPPREPESNGKAESGVGYIKQTARALRSTAGADLRYRHLAMEWAAIVHNNQACSANQGESAPSYIWDSAPGQWKRLLQPPWGCRAFSFAGKDNVTDTTNQQRATAGIFVGYSKTSPAYRVLDLDTMTIKERSRVRFFESDFPLKDMLEAGELCPSDRIQNPDGWRRFGALQPSQVTDAQLGNYLGGKSIQLVLPEEADPEQAPNRWTARVHRLVQNNDQQRTQAVIVELMHFDGDHENLHSRYRGYRNPRSPLTMKLQISTGYKRHAARPTDEKLCLRSILETNYPRVRTLSDYAEQSATRYGGPPVPAPVSAPHSIPEEPTKPLSLSSPESLPPATSRKSPAGAVPRLRFNGGGGIGKFTLSIQGELQGETRGEPWEAKHSTPVYQCGTPPSPSVQGEPQEESQGGTDPFEGESREKSKPARPPPGTPKFIPRNWKEARDDVEWAAADERELEGLRARGAYTNVQGLPPGVRAIPMIMRRELKEGFIAPGKHRHKSRLVVDGSRQFPKPEGKDTFSATPPATGVKAFVSCACQDKHFLRKCDVSQAFLQSDDLEDPEVVYVIPPPGHRHNDQHYWRLIKAVYGLGIASAKWHKTVCDFLRSKGWAAADSNNTIWTTRRQGATLRMLVHVDDLLISGDKDAAVQDWLRTFLGRFDGNEEPAHHYIGLQIDYDRTAGRLKLHQTEFTEELLRDQGLADCNPVAVPMEPNTYLYESDRPEIPDAALRTKYMHVVGSLLWLGQWTRPELRFALSQLTKHMCNPGQIHWEAAKRVLRFLRGKPSDGITYTRGLPGGNQLQVYADSDWASDRDSRRSTGGHCAILNGGSISESCKKHTCVAHSSAEAEFMEASKAALQVVWLRRILAAFGHHQHGPTPLGEDNRACQLMSEAAGQKDRVKHIDLRVWSLKEKVAEGVVQLHAVPTAYMPADIFTKALPQPAFERHCAVVQGLALPPPMLPRVPQ